MSPISSALGSVFASAATRAGSSGPARHTRTHALYEFLAVTLYGTVPAGAGTNITLVEPCDTATVPHARGTISQNPSAVACTATRRRLRRRSEVARYPGGPAQKILVERRPPFALISKTGNLGLLGYPARAAPQRTTSLRASSCWWITRTQPGSHLQARHGSQAGLSSLAVEGPPTLAGKSAGQVHRLTGAFLPPRHQPAQAASPPAATPSVGASSFARGGHHLAIFV